MPSGVKKVFVSYIMYENRAVPYQPAQVHTMLYFMLQVIEIALAKCVSCGHTVQARRLICVGAL